VHLFAAKPGGFTDDEGIIDLEQSPADIVILSAADSALAALADSAESLPEDFPSIRLANWMHLLKPASLDLYRDKVIDHASVVVLSLLGGKSYWQYGLEQLQEWAEQGTENNPGKKRRHLIVVPGDDTPDEELFSASTVAREEALGVWRYFREGGASNNRQLLNFLAAQYFAKDVPWYKAQALPNCMLYMPENFFQALPDRHGARQSSSKNSCATYSYATLQDWRNHWDSRWQSDGENKNKDKKHKPVCLVLFYRSHLQSANTAMFDKLIVLLEEQGLSPLPLAIASLKDVESLELVNTMLEQSGASLIVNTTGFSSNKVSAPDLSSEPTSFTSGFVSPVPVLQLILSGTTEEDWQDYSQGLQSRDIAMQIVLPEIDGRVITRAVSFKAEDYYSERCEATVVRYNLHDERARFVVALAKNYCRLVSKPNSDKRVALILANYPTKDGRIGNGVGLDTPESVINILNALMEAGYPLETVPENGNALIEALLEVVTNNPNTLHHLPCWQSLCVEEYKTYFSTLPEENQKEIIDRWGEPEQDPKYRNGRLMLSGIRLGETFVGIQPARGFNMDLSANYHDPDLVPPHNYLAFYFWLRYCYEIDAVVHVGKHGNLEWLPGKGTALSENCWPDIAMGPVPHFYPFIVNDPGEGAQAKRRTQAVIIDHLMPPLTRAETYGELTELETLVDEYYQAMTMDVRREKWLREKIIQQIKSTHVLEELSVKDEDDEEEVLTELDAYLCDIKEAQIRYGLHRLGALPEEEKLSDTIVALLRLPRGSSETAQGILHNLCHDLNLNDGEILFDPLKADHEAWQGSKPNVLEQISDELWRSKADTRERLELFAVELVKEYVLSENNMPDDFCKTYPHTAEHLRYAKESIYSALQKSADQEIQALLTGLRGQFVEPGPSGAPSRGRLDTLPTGRNFFSVDNRSIPSSAAWAIGEKSAQAMIERHLQEHGDYPKQVGLSVWGTATMRTGGDDIAQAFALMGIKPIWAEGSQRVVDFEITPTMLLGRPRVDVTLRVSGFFRDAFPNVMKLFDSAVLALAELEEPGNGNTIKANIASRAEALCAEGVEKEEAFRQASFRVFGSKPGAYGAGLQGLIDERCWEEQSDLAEAYLNWGGYAYGRGNQDGVEAKQALFNRLSHIDTVVQNQDNREHDLLDSDDYYQFQGGMTNAVSVYAGEQPTVYHNDHSNPEMPKVRTLKEELNRVVRSRVLNPKWIGAMREHGYKGAFEMAASVDYLFAYDATTDLIDDYQYENIAESLIFDQDNRAFLQENNVNALEEMAERLLEATQRGMWGDNGEYAERLQDLLLELDASQEGGQEGGES